MKWLLSALFVLATLLAGCTTTTTTTSAAAAGGGGAEPDKLRVARARLELAGLYLNRGQPTVALDEVKRALAAKPDMPEAYNLFGLIYASLGDTAQAESSFQRALQLAPQDAERTLGRSFELDPANPVTTYNLSDVLLHRGELQRARFYIARINSQPELVSAQSLWLAARIERRIGNVQGVQDFGRKLQERFPESNEVLLYERGRFDE